MDLLVEKLDGSRYYLSQYKVLITDFEESAPSVTRNSKQLDQRNGNIDFGGWHTGKTINITGYYRADDMDEEETLREKLYALLSDPDGYYITQLKTTPSVAMERPGETSGGYYDKLKDYPSHKRFLVYTEAPEMELVGNVNGTLLYKLTAEFKTMKLPYGESVPRNLDVKPNVPYIGRNYIINSDKYLTGAGKQQSLVGDISGDTLKKLRGKQVTISVDVSYTNARHEVGERCRIGVEFTVTYESGQSQNIGAWKPTTAGESFSGRISQTMVFKDEPIIETSAQVGAYSQDLFDESSVGRPKLEIGTTATPWSLAPEEPDYNKWYFDTYYNTKNIAIPYSGTVPCNQIEQGFTIEMTAKDASSSLSFKIDDTELTYNGAVASGDVFIFNGFSYTQNGLSIVSKTNKAYFILQPDKPNRITCNVHGTVKIIGFQNLYA